MVERARLTAGATVGFMTDTGLQSKMGEPRHVLETDMPPALRPIARIIERFGVGLQIPEGGLRIGQIETILTLTLGTGIVQSDRYRELEFGAERAIPDARIERKIDRFVREYVHSEFTRQWTGLGGADEDRRDEQWHTAHGCGCGQHLRQDKAGPQAASGWLDTRTHHERILRHAL
jgi:hypothetical protein